ncbi:hypothetical protein NQ317_011291 [Molorchus minor]|uniref:alpha-mannosidase n=1 Tax=Molorchus minor TaxID=1323400 RepID=A0ABQ9JXX8_9CUCU|nr:hypothetical protein NQ317_011291 [Molorchus minor]
MQFSRVIIVCFSFVFTVQAKPHLFSLNDTLGCGYQVCPATDPNKINVHLIPHSHDDLGWLKTVDEYFNDQTYYLHRWWEMQDDATKENVKRLINEGRLEIINGGWSMNDEANTHYQGTIDQFTLGHKWLYETFGECGLTKTGWQIDPFGHSREQASIYSQMGFDSFIFMRYDYRDQAKRKSHRTMDLLWRGSDNLGKDSNIFTSTFTRGTYAWPPGFCYDISCGDAEIVTDEDSSDFNWNQVVSDFAGYIADQVQYYPTNNLFITMGDDVHYTQAQKNFANIDKLISGFKKYNPNIYGKELNVFYSTPSCYAKAVNEYVIRENAVLDHKTDDFMPLISENDGCWTGFFTSRPTSKRYERISNHYLQATKQLIALAGLPQELSFNLANAVGVMQHHDAITGTELQAVEKDYHRSLYAGIFESVQHISKALTKLLGIEQDIDLHYCAWANVSICHETKEGNFRILLYNPLGRTVTEYVQVPVDDGAWTVTDPEVKKILMFKAENIPPLGYKVYEVAKTGDVSELSNQTQAIADRNKIGFEKNYVILDEETGFIKTMAINGFELNVTPKVMFYYSDYGSGAYMFKPDVNRRDPVSFSDKVENQITTSDLSIEIRQEMRDWGIMTIRIYQDTDYIENDWLAGPVDVGDGSGRDVIIKYTTDLATAGTFYTDSNSRELIKRQRNFRPTFNYTNGEPQSGNYYPVTTRMVLRDEDRGVQFAVIIDRAQGGSSLNDGELELMVHRATLRDEFGGEHLYEMEYGTGLVARGSHYLTFGPVNSERNIYPLLCSSPNNAVPEKAKSFLNQDLPDNVHLLTIQRWNDDANTYLIRLEHFLEKDDDSNLSTEVEIDLENLFTVFTIVSAEERTLNGVTPLRDVSRMNWPQLNDEEERVLGMKNRSLRDDTDLKIALAPMQIRTCAQIFSMTRWLLLALSVYGIYGNPVDFTDDIPVCGYDSCHSIDHEKINIHLVPHSHDDVGWLRTVDQYFYYQVQYIISSVVSALLENPNRRFIQVETAYFYMWWNLQKDETKSQVKQLINEGRLEIINGAWSMNDEANVHYQSTIDQYTLALKFLEDALGKCARPRMGWQIDPFGHSREHASLLSQFGMDGVFFARVDYRDKSKRMRKKTMDMLWTGSANLGSDTNIFTSVLYKHYSAPGGFCFDVTCNDQPIIVDPASPIYNWKSRVDSFADYVRQMLQSYPTRHVLIPFGDDFKWEAALNSYINLDRLIEGFDKFNITINKLPVNIIYSTPSCYAKAVRDYVEEYNVTLEVKTDDFFPYADTSTTVWSGYFTSRPTSKRLERFANNLHQVAKQITAFGNKPADTNLQLSRAMGVMQHHDAITGTEKTAVEIDYHRSLVKGMNIAISNISTTLSAILGLDKDLNLKSCLLSNVSICAESSGDNFNLLVYNPLSRSASHYIQVPVNDGEWKITGPSGEVIEGFLSNPIRNFDYITQDTRKETLNKVLFFRAESLPPLGYNVYNFQRVSLVSKSKEENVVDVGQIGFSDRYINMNLHTRLLESITLNNVTLNVSQDMYFYNSTTQSGAYIFQPNSNSSIRFGDPTDLIITEGGNVKEVKQIWNDYVTQIIRVFKDEDFVEFDWVIGPALSTTSGDYFSKTVIFYLRDVKVQTQISYYVYLTGKTAQAVGANGFGKEIITRYTTNLDSNEEFYTDSNGREMIYRKTNYRPTYTYTDTEPVADNYYPVNTKILIKDDTTEFAVLTDRSEGGSSLNSGEIELMLTRNLLHDDNRGVGEFLNESEYNQGLVVRGSHFVTLGKSLDGNGGRTMAAVERDIAQRKLLQPWVFFTPEDVSVKQLSFLNKELPENVHLLTLETWNDSDNTFLLRLEHILEKDEDPTLSQEVTVDISDLFSTFKIKSMKEYLLAGNTPLEESTRLKWAQVTKPEDESSPLSMQNRLARDITDLNITLAPMQIRTFIATVE